MPETETPPQTPPPSQPTPTPPPPPSQPAAENGVPLSRFNEVNDRMKEAEKKAEELEKWKTEQEQANLSELEKERKAREKAETEAKELKAKTTRMERSALVRKAAQEANFVDPEDAVTMLDLGKIDDEDKAKEAVKGLAEEKGHLVSKAGPTRIGAPLSAGRPGDVPTGPDGKPDEQAGLGQEIRNALFPSRR